ncbi:MAG: 6-bladed beta-propeller [Myxococcaceae bacterium]
MNTHWKQLAAMALAAASTGCATTAATVPDIVWPDPPETARIKYVRTIRSSADVDPSAGAAFLRTLFGSGDDVVVRRPMGLAVSTDGQRLYIADYDGQRVLVADFLAKTLKPLAPESATGTFFGIALDASENVYVTDSAGRKVLVLSRSGEPLRSFGTAESLERPTGIAIDAARGLVYVVDTATKSRKFRVLVYDLQGKHLRDLGKGAGGGDEGFNFPTYLAVSAEGLVYVADTMNFRVQVFNSEGKFIRKYGTMGDGPGTFARLKGVAVDGFGNLYTVEGGAGVVQIFNRDFEPLMFFGGPAVSRVEYLTLPSCITIDPARNRIYVCQEVYPRINVYDLVNTTAGDAFEKPGPK